MDGQCGRAFCCFAIPSDLRPGADPAGVRLLITSIYPGARGGADGARHPSPKSGIDAEICGPCAWAAVIPRLEEDPERNASRSERLMPRCYCHPAPHRPADRGQRHLPGFFWGLEPCNRSTEASKTMLIEIRMDKTSLRRWQLGLVERLSRNPLMRVVVSWGNAIEPLPSCIECLFALERLINGLPDTGAASYVTEACFSSYAVAVFDEPDLVLDLCGPAEQGSAPT